MRASLVRVALSACTVLLIACGLPSTYAFATDFDAGSLIIPMDTDYQDDGLFKAFGLVYQLLLADVPVHWAIREGKEFGDPDFTVDSRDVQSGSIIDAHGYRAGPFVVDSVHAEPAMVVIEAWQAEHVTVVHEATASFESDVARTLVSAPTIAMFADGNQRIARRYMLAAGIPDSTGDLAWPDDSPDMLTPEEVAGPTSDDRRDGALFDEEGIAAYCQLMSMHWGVREAERNPGVVAEVREFLRSPTHFFAECQAVNAFENSVEGRFLTPYGFAIDNVREGDPVDFFNPDSPFAQMDGVYEVVRGSERSYTPCGNEDCTEPGEYLAGGVVMITEQGTPEGTRDVWMTGFLDGNCPPDAKECEDEDGARVGKVSYLGGHEYTTDLPLSRSPESGGTRLFLQSLFEAPCATFEGQSIIELTMIGPTLTTDGSALFEIRYENVGGSVAVDVTIENPIPAGSTLVAAPEGAVAEGLVTWEIGSLEPGTTDTIEIALAIGTPGESIENTAAARWLAGLNERTSSSNSVTTRFDGDRDSDGVGDLVDICPDHPNPAQDLGSDPNSCGVCGTICTDEECIDGDCTEAGTETDVDVGDDVGTDTEDDAADLGEDVPSDAETAEDAEDAEDTAVDAETDDAADDSSGGVDQDEDAGVDSNYASELSATAEPEDNIVAVDTSSLPAVGVESGCACNHSPTSSRSPGALIGLFVVGLLARRRVGRSTD